MLISWPQFSHLTSIVKSLNISFPPASCQIPVSVDLCADCNWTDHLELRLQSLISFLKAPGIYFGRFPGLFLPVHLDEQGASAKTGSGLTCVGPNSPMKCYNA